MTDERSMDSDLDPELLWYLYYWYIEARVDQDRSVELLYKQLNSVPVE